MTSTGTTAPAVRISCACKVCKINAEKVGAAFPLAATVPAPLAALSKKAHHRLITDAHNPGAIGAAMRTAYTLTAV